MPLVIPPGYAQASVQIRHNGDPDPWYITHGVDLRGAGGDYEDAATEIMSRWCANILAQLPTSARCSGVQLRIGQDGDDPLTLFFPFDVPGGSGSAKLPQNCALLVTKVTARSGRTGKGRVFLPSILNDTDVDNIGVVSGSTVTGLQGDFTLMLAAMAEDEIGIAVPMVLLHNTGAPGGTAPTPVVGLTVNQVIATQRRRLR